MADLTPLDQKQLQEREERVLAFCAVCSSEATRRRKVAQEGRQFDYRTAFQRDRDRILHSRAFRRLKHKTQVYVPHTGDHPRTRLTHTLEVAQIGRTMARALALNEDLVEAIALGHDLGHTAFGHSGEKTLARILAGQEESCPLGAKVLKRVGTFKHNYQSLRVVDLLEQRYDHQGLNLTDQVREGILKHTSWKARLRFPLPESKGLRLSLPCHLEGQVVALADEIAQQTHDLEDGLQANAVSLAEVERLGAAEAVIQRAGNTYTSERRRWRRATILQRGLIHMFVTDAIQRTARSVTRFAGRQGIQDREAFRDGADEISATTVALSRPVTALFKELKAFIYHFIINHQEVNRQDHRARRVLTGLFRAYHENPLLLPTYALLRFHEQTGRAYLRDVPIPRIPEEVASHYHDDPRYVRLAIDHLAGMSDRFALEEYASLYHPAGGLLAAPGERG